MSNLKKLILILVLFVLLVGGYAVYMFCFYKAPVDVDTMRMALGETTTEAPAESAEKSGIIDINSSNPFMLVNVTTLTNIKDNTKRAYISINKSVATKATPAQFCEFYDKVVAKNADALTRYTIVFDDQTGIEFNECSINEIYYGKLGSQGDVPSKEKHIYLCKDNSVMVDQEHYANKVKSSGDGVSLDEYKSISSSGEDEAQPQIRIK